MKIKKKDKTVDPIDKVNGIIIKVIAIIFATIVVLISVFAILFTVNLGPVDEGNKEEIKFVVEKGWGTSNVADSLDDNGLIKSSLFFKIYNKYSKKASFQYGTYTLNKGMNVEEIIDILSSSKNSEESSKLGRSVTFVEGKRFTDYVDKMSSEFNFKSDDIIKLCSDKEFLNELITKYWFIDESILDSNIKYPLEGYLFPDTYSFKNEVTSKEIIITMLDQMDKKLSSYKDKIQNSGKSINSLLTLASMVELEAVTPEDRYGVAGVFNNRLNIGMPLGSDVTTYYAVGKKMGERLTTNDLNGCNAYNTRGTCAIKSLPVGPICSPSMSSIVAALEPKESKYYYFVADVNNKVYFAENLEGHYAIIRDLKNKNIWPE